MSTRLVGGCKTYMYMDDAEKVTADIQEKQLSPSGCDYRSPDPKEDEHSLSHPQALQKAREHITQLLSDPFLHDLPPDVSLDELKSRLALEQGKAITLYLRRHDGDSMRE